MFENQLEKERILLQKKKWQVAELLIKWFNSVAQPAEEKRKR